MNSKTTALTKFKALQRKVDQLFALKKISAQDLDGMSEPERNYLRDTINEKLAQLKGAERDNFLNKIEFILAPGTKNSIWEHNHLAINSAISNYIRTYGNLPSKTAIAEETGLSRQTVATHFSEYKRHPEFMAQMEQFKFMAGKLLSNVLRIAINGDMKAARLYFEMIGAVTKMQTSSVVNEQNNYVQINNTLFSPENLSALSAEQLNQIENIISNNKTMAIN